MIMVDVTGLDVAPGDEVVLIGRQGDEEITAREIASAIGTIPWEVVCRLGARIERRYAHVRSQLNCELSRLTWVDRYPSGVTGELLSRLAEAAT